MVKLWDYVDEIRQGNYRELTPFLVTLVEEPNEALLEEERALILQEQDVQKRADLLASAVAVGSRYFAKAFLWKFFQKEIEQMKTATFIDDWITEGIEKAQGMAQEMAQGMAQGMTQGFTKGVEQGIQQNSQQSIIEVLNARFGEVSSSLMVPLIHTINPTTLNYLLTKAATVASVTEFKQILDKHAKQETLLGISKIQSTK